MKYLVIGSVSVVLMALLFFNYLQPESQTANDQEAPNQSVPAVQLATTESPPQGTPNAAENTAAQKPLLPLQTKDLVIGSGKQVKEGSKVAFNVIIKLQDGRIVFNSYKEGRPWEGIVGNGSILTGLDRGIQGMFQGSKRALWIPPHLAFGPTGIKNQVPPNANLYAEVEMLSIF